MKTKNGCEFYKHRSGRHKGKWDWRVWSQGRITATSHNQGYNNLRDAVRAFKRVQKIKLR